MPKLRHLAEYGLLRGVAGVLRGLPVDVSLRLGRQLGLAAGLVIRSRVRLAHQNLRAAFDDRLTTAERRALIRQLLALLGEGLAESLVHDRGVAQRTVAVEGWAHLEHALARGRGVIIVPPHLGMWELAAFTLGQRLGRAATVYRPLRNPYVDAFVRRLRTQSGLVLIPSRNGLRQAYTCLRQGGVVIMLLDQNAGRTGVPATFFGRVASTFPGPGAFALRTGCAVLPGYIVKEPGKRQHRLVLGEAFPVIRTGRRDQDVLANTQRYNDYIEAVVRAHPDQWFGWLHRRWRQPRFFLNAAAPVPP